MTSARWTNLSIVAEHLTPSAERFVRHDDQTGPFVSTRDQPEEQVRCLRFERDVTDLIDDEQRITPELDQLRFQSPSMVNIGKASNPLGCSRKKDSIPTLAGADGEPDRQVRFPCARRPKEDDIVLRRDEIEGAQMGDSITLQTASVVEV